MFQAFSRCTTEFDANILAIFCKRVPGELLISVANKLKASWSRIESVHEVMEGFFNVELLCFKTLLHAHWYADVHVIGIMLLCTIHKEFEEHCYLACSHLLQLTWGHSHLQYATQRFTHTQQQKWHTKGHTNTLTRSHTTISSKESDDTPTYVHTKNIPLGIDSSTSKTYSQRT